MNYIDIWLDTVEKICPIFDPHRHESNVYSFSDLKSAEELFTLVGEYKDLEKDVAVIKIENLDCLDSALKYSRTNKVCVLNFANPVKPALGIPKSNTQEEDIIRRSDLGLYLYDIPSIKTKFPKGNQFYPIKKEHLIYSKNVLVIKNNRGEQIRPFNIDIITAVALIAPAKKIICGTEAYKRPADYEYMLFYIELIFQTAIFNNIDVLILGAFGCGAFLCPVYDTATIFKTICQKYKQYFKIITFSITDSLHTKNYDIFCDVFSDIAS
jgi:uncharacterized protein (TIGR02452 family)